MTSLRTQNDYSKGILEAYLSTIPAAMMRMSEFRPVKIKKSVPPAMGTAFAGEGEKKGGDKKKSASGGVGRLSSEEWYALSEAEKAKLRKEREDAKNAKEAKDKKPSKSKNSDDKSTL